MGETLQLVDVLADKGLDYLHVSLQDFWSKARREADTSKTCMELLLGKINKRIHLIGLGSIYTTDDEEAAIQTGIGFLALGRELVIDPNEELDMPEAFWERYYHCTRLVSRC